MMDVCQEKCLHPEAVALARASLEGAPVEIMADIFKVLGDPTRSGILLALSTGELCVCDLAELFGITSGGVSHQLRILKAHRLVRGRREGKLVFYSLDDAHVASLLKEGIVHAREER
jgi:DNA-binding transcriptional ArsR family regulator